MIVAGASAYSRIIDFERIGKVAKAIGALFFVDMAHIAGLVGGGSASESGATCGHRFDERRTRRCAGRAADWFCARRHLAKNWINSHSQGTQGGPLVHMIAAKAVCLKEAMEPSFKDYQKQVAQTQRRWQRPWRKMDSASSPAAQTTTYS